MCAHVWGGYGEEWEVAGGGGENPDLHVSAILSPPTTTTTTTTTTAPLDVYPGGLPPSAASAKHRPRTGGNFPSSQQLRVHPQWRHDFVLHPGPVYVCNTLFALLLLLPCVLLRVILGLYVSIKGRQFVQGH